MVEKEAIKSDERFSFLYQLIMSLDEAEIKMEEAYRRKNQVQLRNMKDFILKIQKKISEEIDSRER